MGGEQPPKQPTATHIEWTDNLSVGIDANDSGHKILLGLLNRSRVATANSDEAESVTLLEQLKDYTQPHFRCEEAVMEACGYPGLDNHCQVHQLLLREVGRMQRQKERGELGVAELAALLNKWLVDHIHGNTNQTILRRPL